MSVPLTPHGVAAHSVRGASQNGVTAYAQTALGRIAVTVEDGAVTGVFLRTKGLRHNAETPSPCDAALAARALSQIAAYARGRRTDFNLPIRPQGTPFQLAVWAQLQKIPYGQTRTYGDIAAALDNPRAARAVGAACHCNDIPIIIPCHRVVGKGGALTGFSDGLPLKKKLLALEARRGAKF